MEAIMDAQGVWESIEPTVGVTVDEKKNKMARAYILQAIPEDILMQVAKKKTAKEVWESLKIRYLGADRVQKVRLHSLKSEFDALRMKEGETIDEFAGKLGGINSKYISLGATMEDNTLVRKLLDSVPEKFLQLVASIEQYSDLDTMPFEEDIGRLKAYEDRLRVRGENSNAEVGLLLTRSEGQMGQKSQKGSLSAAGRGRGSSNERGGRGDTDEWVLLNEDKVFPATKGNEKDTWYLDNGASNHMTGVREYFAELDERITGQVRFGD
ncbi:hypothetical protein Lser_V15G16133 [Lactuca serriola]